MRKTDNVLWIAPRDEIAAKEKLELEAANAIQNLEPLRTQSFQLNYTKAAEVATQFQAGGGGAGGGRILSARGSVVAEPRTNQLFVTDISSSLEKVQQLINKLDVAVRQVMIEARVVEASDTWGKSLGVRLGGALDTTVGPRRISFGNNYGNVTPSAGATTGNFVNFPASGLGLGTPAAFAVSIFNAAANRFLALELQALEGDSKGKIVSAPRVVTANQKTATIESGTDIPYQQATSSGATAVSFKKATLKLEVTPQITPEGNIILDLEVNKDSRGTDTGDGQPTINTKRVKTQVLVENGGTVVIGGIFELTESEGETRVPVLGDLPGVGNLFKNKQRQTQKQEMLVFITPKMINDLSAGR
jgi:type IV pilus assembly protein PilQ